MDQYFSAFILAMAFFLLSLFVLKAMFCFWISPMKKYLKVKGNGFKGPFPVFPLGNIQEMKKKIINSSFGSSDISHNIHSLLFPFFSKWQSLYGKVLVYWLGTEPFLYVAEPEFLKKMSEEVLAKSWGKPTLFKKDRDAMFGNGLLMVEGDDWVRHRHAITPAFNPKNLKAMASFMVESSTQMLEKWGNLVKSGNGEMDVESEITALAGEIIAKTSFGLDYESGRQIFGKLKALQRTLFQTNRFVGVPYSKLLNPGKTLEAKKLGKEIDQLFFSIIEGRRRSEKENLQQDLLSLLMRESEVEGRRLTTRELVDECKTFFFGGHETTALAITWTLLLLAVDPHWQTQLREEIKQVLGEKETDFDFSKLSGLKKMGWVMNEVLRLYPTAPNAQRQARRDIQVENLRIPNGTNIWIDIVAMHHDPTLWGEDVDRFRPDRFKDNLHGGCKHKMGFLPFGFGGRMCVGRNLSLMEYKIVLTLILTRFSFTLSPTYVHSPSILLSLRPSFGIPLLLHRL